MLKSEIDELCVRIQELQAIYANLFVRLGKIANLDPAGDCREIEQFLTEIEAFRRQADDCMKTLRPRLEEWKAQRDRLPKDVNAFVDRFLSLIGKGVREAVTLIERRADLVAERRDQIKAALLAIQERGQSLAGYKTSARTTSRVIDSQA
ncbi:MAG: hypothetical protein NTX50_05570 [Candidatus Sumerlaeota bacterium]|nr:hypothetical protein [Candidatus Sumerlaeota bacterium]